MGDSSLWKGTFQGGNLITWKTILSICSTLVQPWLYHIMLQVFGCISQPLAIPKLFFFFFSLMVKRGNATWSSAKPKHINNPNQQGRSFQKSQLDVNPSSYNWVLVHMSLLRAVRGSMELVALLISFLNTKGPLCTHTRTGPLYMGLCCDNNPDKSFFHEQKVGMDLLGSRTGECRITSLNRNCGVLSWRSRNQSDQYAWGLGFDPWPHSVG